MKKLFVVVITLFVVVAGMGIFVYSSVTEVSAGKYSVTYQSRIEVLNIFASMIANKKCALRGGSLEAVFGPSPICHLPLSDSGKACTDSNQCTGYCQPDSRLLQEVKSYVEALPGNQRSFINMSCGDGCDGACSRYDSGFDTNPSNSVGPEDFNIDNGSVKTIPRFVS